VTLPSVGVAHRFPMLFDPSNKDTIAAISTPLGLAGIGIVRISGPGAKSISRRIFRPKSAVKTFQSHHLYLGYLIDPDTGGTVDEVFLSVMGAPHSYTREDVVEINSHSGYLLLSQILQIVLQRGARLAEPGEFTFRAFMNGRIDLSQAEAIMDLIHSPSERGLRLAADQMKGCFRSSVDHLRQKAVECLACLEVGIDYPDEEPDALPRADQIEEELIKPIRDLIGGYSQRKIWMEGIKTVIIGRVNAGKSSLLNRLLNEERAMVTPIPGTTRDIIESTLYIEGLPLRLMDTAGFRRGRGTLEKMGMDLTRQKMEEADLILVVIDRSRPLHEDELNRLGQILEKRFVVILNKMDLPSKIREEDLKAAVGGIPLVRISALTGEGIDELRRVIKALVLEGEEAKADLSIAPNVRQKLALEEAGRCFTRAAQNLKDRMPLEIVAVDMNEGLSALGEITGETTTEDILDRIFSQFCLGK
jgi:tRNA modification GTPase